MSVEINIPPGQRERVARFNKMTRSERVKILSRSPASSQISSTFGVPTAANLKKSGAPERLVGECQFRLRNACQLYRTVFYNEIGHCVSIARFLDAETDKSAHFGGRYALACAAHPERQAEGFRFVLQQVFEEKQASKIFNGARLFYAEGLSPDQLATRLRSEGGYQVWADRNSSRREGEASRDEEDVLSDDDNRQRPPKPSPQANNAEERRFPGDPPESPERKHDRIFIDELGKFHLRRQQLPCEATLKVTLKKTDDGNISMKIGNITVDKDLRRSKTSKR